MMPLILKTLFANRKQNIYRDVNMYCVFLCFFASLLPSWNEGPAKNAILEFIEDSKNIPEEERIVTFDEDGTLWVEQPNYTQFEFALSEYPNEEMSFEKLIKLTHSGMSVQAFHDKVQKWLEIARHPRFKKPYTELVYQPMLEVIALFQKNGFKTYIVSGGGQEFIRVISQKLYNIPLTQVIGTAGKLRYEDPTFMKLPEVLFIDDKAGKPEAIYLFTGRNTLAAFGNSDGDREMLQSAKRLKVLVHHDDAEREYAYGPESKVGTFSESLMQEAKAKGWIIVSMKNDWKTIFAEPLRR